MTLSFNEMTEEPHMLYRSLLGARKMFRKEFHDKMTIEVKPPHRHFDLNKAAKHFAQYVF